MDRVEDEMKKYKMYPASQPDYRVSPLVARRCNSQV